MNDFVISIKDKKFNVSLSGNSVVSADGREYHQELFHLSGDTYLLKLDNKIYEITVTNSEQGNYQLAVDGKNYDVVIRTALQEKAVQLIDQGNKNKHKADIKAPMPGLILKIKKSPGDEVIQGESVMILEAMKMENDLHAPFSGIIKKINVKEGNTVEKGYVLFTIE